MLLANLVRGFTARASAAAAIGLVALTGASLGAVGAQAAGPRPFFQLPVTCGETWNLSTYVGHDDYDIDLTSTAGNDWGRPILAAYGGRVERSGISGTLGDRTPSNPNGPRGTGGGYYVKIDHGDGWQTLYLHMLEPPMVSVGQRVTIGQQLGKVGSTGDSSGPHLHFEQVRDGAKIESWFNGVPSGITHDNAVYTVKRQSANCGPTQVRPVDRLAVAPNADGRLQAFAVRDGGAVKSTWQTSVNGPFSPWISLGGTKLRAPVVAPSSDGRLEMFAIGSDGKLYHKWQTTPNGSWSAWLSRGGTDLTSEMSIGRNADGRLQVFVVGGNGAIYSMWQTSLNGPWSDWLSMGGSELQAPVVGSSADSRLELFAIGGDGKLYHKWQTSPNGPWSDWLSRGGTNLTNELTIGRNADGRSQVFVIGGDGALYSMWQNSANGPWSDWLKMGGRELKTPVVGSSADGRMELFAVGGDGKLYHRWQTSPNGPWSDWLSRGGTDLSGDLVLGSNRDGRLQAFVIGGNDALYSIWQTSVNGPWGDWASLS
ncbi:peptidoglycan DD-metalloendopeptidase family protein [Micromonospora sp. NPDC048839]|uniref:peptidoglycan DD-metalloendopeptidase family protein n=1 Tax=Micromonospora sp. NPDC048839 TaxID=3155641 RepID=UPI0033EE3E9C